MLEGFDVSSLVDEGNQEEQRLVVEDLEYQ
jgi:hypothetical protein